MNRTMKIVTVGLVCAGLGMGFFGLPMATGQEKRSARPPAKTSQAWTLDEARAQLRLNPQDVYLQYVALQMARPENKTSSVSSEIRSLNRTWRRGPEREVDLFDLFTGALAVQESLQLDTMRGAAPNNAELGNPRYQTVKVTDLVGPTVKSHPWGEMLAAQSVTGRKPEVSPLAMYVPEDQYFVLFRSLSKLMEVTDAGNLWGDHVFNQADASAQTHRSSEKLKTQLAIKTDPLSRPFYDLVVDEVALTGSDLYFREGGDVTIVFAVKQPPVFRLKMDGYLAAAEKSRADAVRSTGKILGVEYVSVTTPDRAVHAFSAYPKPNLHVRSNSKIGLERVLETILGKTADGRDVARLGDSTEFKYIRTLMLRGAEEEGGFVYLSDPFIRRVVGPQLKLTERRRMLCYNHLRMIGHAAMLYRTQYGRAPRSLEELHQHGCAPGVFGSGDLTCSCGGRYSLSEDGTTGVCSHHGHAQRLVPCAEIPLTRVTQKEADEYKQFVERYSQYWRQFFDPIAIRLQVTPEQYRAETIILPLIDNGIYTEMAKALGGEPEDLDALPVPKRNIFSVAVKLDKQNLLTYHGGNLSEFLRQLRYMGVDPTKTGGITPEQFLRKGIGNQIGLHVCDASPMFDFNLAGFLGEAFGQRGGGSWLFGNDTFFIGFLIASLNSPVYVSAPVKDAEIVDQFLEQVDVALAHLARRRERGGWFQVDNDFYRVPLDEKDGDEPKIRCYNLSVGPIKWRMFFARIGDGLYIASKRFILDDLAEANRAMAKARAEGKPRRESPNAHAMVRVRPKNWNEVLPSFRMGWAEGSRGACLNNLGPLSSVARAVTASRKGAAKPGEIHRQADHLHAVHFFCPDGGRYRLSPDGKEMTCSVHGTALHPRQPAAPTARSAMGRLLDDFGGLTAELTFLEDGLHAVVTIDRK